MRNISFNLTQSQVQNKTKTVTRRLGWLFLKEGEILQAVKKSQGLKKGEKVKPICLIKIEKLTREPLDHITKEEVKKEGFPHLSPVAFVLFFLTTHKAIRPSSIITRIQFSYI